MVHWSSLYQERTVQVEEAIGHISAQDTVCIGAYCNEPQTLVEELVRQRERIEKATLVVNVLGSAAPYAQKECFPYFHLKALLPNFALRRAWEAGCCDYVPVNLAEIPKFLRETVIDVALIQVSPPDEEGFCSLGISVDANHTLVEQARLVIAEVNERVPVTYGATKVKVDQIDLFVQSARSLIALPESELSERGQQIGQYVAQLVPDGATIQVGVGSLPDDILFSLRHKRDLGIHSGSITDGVMDLMEKGVVTNRRKTLLPGKVVCTTIVGTERLYHYVHENPLVEVHPVDFTHHGGTISQIDHFYAINSALDVDLSGQVNAEMLKDTIVAGVGGQMDFIRGAQYSRGGRSIIALPATTNDGKRSRIQAGVARVTSLKSDVDYVVTEYGIAALFGKSLSERAQALIAIAAPAFRDELTEAWKNIHRIRKG